MEDKDAVIKELKAEVYDMSKELTGMRNFIAGMADKLGLQGEDVTLENIVTKLEEITE